ncbi:MAG: Membrane-bound lytic murein transglycosylase F [Acidobacteria bacterium]|nr:Membrane-bound lytic murein transglycosylase F [Acidobacteriota bacterium]
MRLSFVAKRPMMVILVCLLLCAAGVRADELHLKNGRMVEAEEVWEVGDAIWYRQGKVIASFARTDVARITKSKPAPAASLSSVSNSGESANGDEMVTRTVSRILLKGGRQIDADAVWENSGLVGYRLGKMQTVIDRRDVERIVHDVTVTEPKSVAANASLRYTTGHSGLDRLIAYSGDKYDIDPTLIFLIMREESRFNHRAVSRVGARGLMQLMPGTAAKLGVRNIHDPVENVDAGTRYLRTLLEMFNGDVNLALAAYNAGEGAVMKYGRRIPPYRETMNYVWRINTAYRRAMAANRNEK